MTSRSAKFYESEEYHIIPDMLQMKREGKIRKFGFSFHGGPQLLEEFLTRHEGVFDFVQIQLNYLDWTLQDAKTKYEIIRRHGLGVWVMEPCRGGKLAVLPESESAKLAAIRKDGADAVSDASYAFRFLQELPPASDAGSAAMHVRRALMCPLRWRSLCGCMKKDHTGKIWWH